MTLHMAFGTVKLNQSCQNNVTTSGGLHPRYLRQLESQFLMGTLQKLNVP